MKHLHKFLPCLLCLCGLIWVAGCSNGSEASPDAEKPVEVGDEASLALPPE
ncbi:hypothetical protein [Gimesia panareensis]|uniref:hypothetical protein n=1 Tax=Gimesia panareensis TaxID=2527978 RepID=UPI0018D7615D|nr:hypothetical protein [Gimesia panareensis]